MKKKHIISEDSYSVCDEKHPKIPCYYIVLLLGYLFLLGYITSLIDSAMPSPISDLDAGTTSFSEERGWRYLRRIVGDGPRVTGTKYHIEKTEDLKSLVEEVTMNARLPVRHDWQVVSGDYWLEQRTRMVNVYDNISNIISMIEGESGFNEDSTARSAILFNCHYDSRPTSPGVSDNALFCAAMVDVMSILSKMEVKFKHNIIFLFNGAEENPLQASHGFLKHPWAKGITGLVNLDSAGINCKSMLFQVTDPRVVTAYRNSVPQPSAQAIGELIFKSGLIPSDTDFRIFRDFGGIHGVDIAFTEMGQVYHTRYDSLDVLSERVLQHSGNMILALAKEMANSDDFSHKVQEPSATVYWDYLNLFMFSYSYNAAKVVDSLIIVFAFVSVLYYLKIVGFRWSKIRELLLCIAGRLLCNISGAIFLWIFTGLMLVTTIQLRYLSNAWIVVPIYWVPYLIGAIISSQLFDAWRCKYTGLSRIRRLAQSMAATRSLIILVVIVLLCLKDTDTLRYVFTAPLFVSSIVSFVSLSVIQFRPLKAWQHLILEVAMATPCLLFYFVLAIKINYLMIPIMGRSTSDTPDLLVAILNMAAVMMCVLPLSGVELLFSRLRLWTVLLAFSLACLVVSFIPFFPYNNYNTVPAVQRHNWFHSEIISYNQAGEEINSKTGIWFGRTEVNTPNNILSLAVERNMVFNNIQLNSQFDCENYTYCNLPLITPRNMEYMPGSIFIDFEPPSTPSTIPQLTLRNKFCLENRCTMIFHMNGPPKLSLMIWPRKNVTLTSWSFEANVKENSILKDRPVYFVHYGRGYSEHPKGYDFDINLQVPSQDSSEPILDISLNAHRTNHPEEYTASFKNLISAMPEYFNVEAFLSTRYNYIF